MRTWRPRDYFGALPKLRQKQLRDALRDLYARHASRQLVDDCVQVAILIILEYPYDLEIGPVPTNYPDVNWCKEVHSVLLRFAKARQVRGAVLRTVYQRKASDPQLSSDEVEGIDPNWDRSIHWFESNLHWAKLFENFRMFVGAQSDADPLELQIVDQLYENALREMIDESAAEVFRGESFQIVNESLLKSLQENFPSVGWTKQKLQVTIAKIRRHAESHREALIGTGASISTNPEQGKARNAPTDRPGPASNAGQGRWSANSIKGRSHD